MQADNHPATRRRQLLQLRWMMRKRLSRVRDPRRHAVIVCGDFNVIAETVRRDGSVAGSRPEYAVLCDLLSGPKGRVRDLYRELNPLMHGATWNPFENPKMVRGSKLHKRLDYVFAVDSLPHADPQKPPLEFRKLVCKSALVLPFRTGDGGNLSDHFGIGVSLACG
jgi:endonuclease/exonuclease/phosphatase family metal-dependent hydrolase